MCPGVHTKGLPFIGRSGQSWKEPAVQWGEWVEVARGDPMEQPKTCHPNIHLFSGGASWRAMCCLRLEAGKIQGSGEGETANLSLLMRNLFRVVSRYHTVQLPSEKTKNGDLEGNRGQRRSYLSCPGKVVSRTQRVGILYLPCFPRTLGSSKGQPSREGSKDRPVSTLTYIHSGPGWACAHKY